MLQSLLPRVKLVNRSGTMIENALGFSAWLFLFGPIYLAYKKDGKSGVLYLVTLTAFFFVLTSAMDYATSWDDIEHLPTILAVVFAILHTGVSGIYNTYRVKGLIKQGFYPRRQDDVDKLSHYGIYLKTADQAYADLSDTFYVRPNSTFLAFVAVIFYIIYWFGQAMNVTYHITKSPFLSAELSYEYKKQLRDLEPQEFFEFRHFEMLPAPHDNPHSNPHANPHNRHGDQSPTLPQSPQGGQLDNNSGDDSTLADSTTVQT